MDEIIALLRQIRDLLLAQQRRSELLESPAPEPAAPAPFSVWSDERLEREIQSADRQLRTRQRRVDSGYALLLERGQQDISIASRLSYDLGKLATREAELALLLAEQERRARC